MSISVYGSITVTDLLDTATYIYYSATNTSTLSSWHISPQSNDEYIGIYSGPPTNSGQPDLLEFRSTQPNYLLRYQSKSLDFYGSNLYNQWNLLYLY